MKNYTEYCRIQITITDEEREAFRRLAESEMRGLKDQIHFILRQYLKERGLIDPGKKKTDQGDS